MYCLRILCQGRLPSAIVVIVGHTLLVHHCVPNLFLLSVHVVEDCDLDTYICCVLNGVLEAKFECDAAATTCYDQPG